MRPSHGPPHCTVSRRNPEVEADRRAHSPNPGALDARISNIEQGTYGPDVVAASDAELDKYLEEWRTKRDVSVQTVAETAVDLSSLSPVDPKRLAALFDNGDDGRYVLRGGETDGVECKQSFHSALHDGLLRAVAALANHRGGYILYGVENATGVLLGLKDDRFKDTDPNLFTQAFRGAMEPCPRFELGTVELGGQNSARSSSTKSRRLQ